MRFLSGMSNVVRARRSGPFVVTLVEDGDEARLRYEGAPGEFKVQAGKAIQAQQLAENTLTSTRERSARRSSCSHCRMRRQNFDPAPISALRRWSRVLGRRRPGGKSSCGKWCAWQESTCDPRIRSHEILRANPACLQL
jgi:hypothetical protein